MQGEHAAFTLVLALGVGVFAQALARRLRLPGIVLLLIAGAGLGPDGLGWVDPEVLDEGLLTIVELSVAVILFEGGLNLGIARLRREQSAIRRLVVYGPLVTLVGGAVAARVFLGWEWMVAVLFGSLVVVTGPTVIGPLVQELRLRPRVSTVLEAEGVLIDPVGAILAVLLLEIVLAPGADSVGSGFRVLVYRVGLGSVGGAAAGFLLAGMLRSSKLVPEGYGNILVLGGVLLLFQGCEEVLSQSGLLAVTIAGVVVGNLRSSLDRDLREFKDQLSILLIGLLFVLLAASVRLEHVLGLGRPGLLVVLALVFLVRPLTVLISTAGSELGWRERVLVAWVAPRGIVAAAVASATAVALDRAGIAGGTQLLALVFLVIASTVVLAGLTAGPVATLLDQRLPGREGVAILGAGGLGILLARELRYGGVPVVFLDSNPQSCRQAEEQGFPVVYGNALQERTLQRARMDAVGTVVGLTANQMLNSVFVSRARERFEVPRALVALGRFEAGLAPELVQEGAAKILFDGLHDVARWDVRARRDAAPVEHFEFREAPPQAEEAEGGSERADRGSERVCLLTVTRGGRTTPMVSDFELKPGDVVAAALHAEELDAAREEMRARGFEPKPRSEPEAA